MILYIEDPKYATKKLLEFINEYSKVAGYKINTQKFVAFLYTNSTLSEKYLGINLPRELKDQYLETCKTWMKETEDNTNTWKDILCSWIGRINILKMTIILYRFNAIPIKIPMA